MNNRSVVQSARNKPGQSGSASIECLMVLGILLPIGMGTVLVGKMHDLHQTATQASRYAIWQSTVQTPANLADTSSERVGSLFFEDPASPIRSGNAEADKSGASSNLLWGYRQSASGSGLLSLSQLSLDSDQAVTSRYQRNLDDARIAGGLTEQVGNLSSLFGAISAGNWTIQGSGLTSASVELDVRSHEWFSDSQNCNSEKTGACFRARGVILSDGWSAASDTQAKERVQTFMPTSVLRPVGNAVAGIGGTLLFPELRGLKNAFGHVDMAVLPDSANPANRLAGQRLVRYKAATAGKQR